MTEGGIPNAVFYPRVQLGQEQETKTEQLQIEAIPENTDFDSEGNYVEDGRGQCVIFKTSAADAFVGTERDPHEFLDYILLDMYWYPGGKFGNSTTCVPDGVEWTDHREWVYGFLSDPEDPSAISTGVHLSYSCITNTSNTHTFNTVGIGLTNQNKFMDDDKSSYKALFTNFGVHKNEVNPNITMPYAHLSLEMKQQFDSWEIITESNPYEFAEMFGNIGGFWDLLLILWPLCFVAATQQDPHLKPRTFKKSVVRGAERAASVSKAIARAAPINPSNTKSASSAVDGFEDEEEVPAWDRRPAPQQQPPQSATTWQDARSS
ncbi:unnamed protein product [Ectocarpus sp. 12 AP-2014]